jgi:hypothetical protein
MAGYKSKCFEDGGGTTVDRSVEATPRSRSASFASIQL